MKIFKTVSAAFLAALLLLSAVACGKTASDKQDDKNASETTQNVTETAAPEETPEDDADSARTAAGTYTGLYTKLVGDETKNTEEEFSLILYEDGIGEHFRDGTSYRVKWEQHGDSVKMFEYFIGDPIEYNGTFKDGQLILFNGPEDDDFTYVYVYQLDA